MPCQKSVAARPAIGARAAMRLGSASIEAVSRRSLVGFVLDGVVDDVGAAGAHAPTARTIMTGRAVRTALSLTRSVLSIDAVAGAVLPRLPVGQHTSSRI